MLAFNMFTSHKESLFRDVDMVTQPWKKTNALAVSREETGLVTCEVDTCDDDALLDNVSSQLQGNLIQLATFSKLQTFHHIFIYSFKVKYV